MSDLRIETKFKNARLYGAIAARYGQLSKNGGIGLREFAAHCGVRYEHVSAYVCLRANPIGRDGGYKASALAIAVGLGETPESLFPAHLYNSDLDGTFVRECDGRRLIDMKAAARIAAPDMEQAIVREGALRGVREVVESSGLNDREKLALRLRFGLEDGEEWTLEAIGQKLGVTQERVRQIEARALRQLRHPLNSHRLLEHRQVLVSSEVAVSLSA